MTTTQSSWVTTAITPTAGGWVATYEFPEDRKLGYDPAHLPVAAVLTQVDHFADKARRIAAVFGRDGDLIPVDEHTVDGEFIAVDPAPSFTKENTQ